MLVLRNPIIPVAFFDEFSDATINHSILPEMSSIIAEKSGASIVLKNIDITGITKIMLQFKNSGGPLHLNGWAIEVRLDDKKGEKIGEANDAFIAANKEQALEQIGSIPLKPSTGMHDLFIVFVNNDLDAEKLDKVQLRTVTFLKE